MINILNMNTICVVSFLLCSTLFGAQNAQQKEKVQQEMPSHFWPQKKVLKVALCAGLGGFAVGGPIYAVVSGGLCHELINFKTRRGLVQSANWKIKQCDNQLVAIAQLATHDRNSFLQALKKSYRLPHDFAKIHKRLKVDKRNLEDASRALHISYSVQPHDELQNVLDHLKSKKQFVDDSIKGITSSLEILDSLTDSNKPISKL